MVLMKMKPNLKPENIIYFIKSTANPVIHTIHGTDKKSAHEKL